MSSPLTLLRQHLIDPEVCIRCNTCEETCPTKAISHDRRNYVVEFDLCNECGDCLPPCPTGAIDSWRRVALPFGLGEQRGWDALPADVAPPAAPSTSAVPDDVARLVSEATRAEGGQAPPPWSAAHPYVGLYSADRPALARVAGSYRLTSEDCDVDIRHVVLDFGKTAFPVLEGQSLGILPPGQAEDGGPHHVRLYSIASPRDGERPGHNNVALTVKRVIVDRAGRPCRGVASSYICDLVKGDEVRVTGPYGTRFLMPNHPGAKLLLVCTGTGAAPMRAMTERLRRRMGRGAPAHVWLFFGARRPEELPYFGPLQKLPRDLIDVELAFSRVPGSPKEWVQDRLRARADVVAGLLQDDETHFFLCGHKRMEEGVLDALDEVCRGAGLVWSEVLDGMRRQGRFHVETY